LFLLAAVFTQEYIDQIKAIILDDISRQTIATIRRGFKLPA
jgi:hypothetical protein